MPMGISEIYGLSEQHAPSWRQPLNNRGTNHHKYRYDCPHLHCATAVVAVISFGISVYSQRAQVRQTGHAKN